MKTHINFIYMVSFTVMQSDETTPLLRGNGLSVFFAILCIVDVFGVFPVVALPKPIIDCGYYGILVILIVCSLQIYTATLLGKCWNLAEEMEPNIKRKSRYPYSALAELAFGKYSAYFVTFLVDITVFGGGIPNLIVAAQNLELLGVRLSEDSVDISFCYWIIILGTMLCPVLWLGSPKDMKVLCSVSVLIVASVYILTSSCLLLTIKAEVPQIEVNTMSGWEIWQAIFSAYGIVTFQFDIHPTILTIQMDMSSKAKLPLAIMGGFSVSLIMFGTTALITALKYGVTSKPSLLETLPTSLPLHFVAALVAIQLCLTSAVSNSALYQHMEDCLNISREFNHKRCILRTILTIIAIIIAESVPRFDLVMSLVGGTLTGPLVFVFPSLFYIKIIYLHQKYAEKLKTESFSNIVLTQPTSTSLSKDYSSDLTKYSESKLKEDLHGEPSVYELEAFGGIWIKKVETGLCVTIIILSSFATCITTYLNISSATLSYANLTKPCIYNISNTLLYL